MSKPHKNINFEKIQQNKGKVVLKRDLQLQFKPDINNKSFKPIKK